MAKKDTRTMAEIIIGSIDEVEISTLEWVMELMKTLPHHTAINAIEERIREVKKYVK